VIRELVAEDPDQVEDYLRIVDLRRIRREYFWKNRAAIAQRLKYDKLKAELLEVRRRVEVRNQDVEKKYFGIQDIVQLLGTDPANEMSVYDVSHVSTINDFEVVVTAASVRHMRHISYTLYKMAKKIGVCSQNPNVVTIEGRNSDDWILVDCGDIMVHFFLEHTRKAHDLESSWQPYKVPSEKWLELQDAHVHKCTVMVHVSPESTWKGEPDSDVED
jgi:ribosome-associated protein